MFRGKKTPLILTVIALLVYGAFVVLAAPPPSGGYNPGTELDPDCTPGSTDCFVRLGIAIGDNVRDGDAGSILYLNSSGDLSQDANFTRDASTGETQITREFSSTSNTITSVTVTDIMAVGTPTGAFQDGETINNLTQTGSATMVHYLSGNAEVMFLTNVTGAFSSGDTVQGATSNATVTVGLYVPAAFSPSDNFTSWSFTSNSATGTGTITGISGSQYSVSMSSGTINQYNLLLDNPNNPTKYAGVITVTTAASTNTISTGFRSVNFFGTEGSFLQQSDINGNSAITGVVDLSGAGGSTFTVMNYAIDPSGNFSSFANNASGAIWNIYNPTLNDSTEILFGASNFSFITNTGNGDVGFSNDGSIAQWQSGGYTFNLPNTPPNANDVLYASSISGSTVSLGWTAPGGGSPLLLQTNGSNNGSQTTLNLVEGANITLTDNGSGSITIDAIGGAGDGSIYINNGTLTGNRVLNGNDYNLGFTQVSQFQVLTSTITDSFNSKDYFSLIGAIPGTSSATDKTGIIEVNLTDLTYSGFSVDADKGIGFSVQKTLADGSPEYWFPINDGGVNQVLRTDGAGQLSWIDGGWSLTGNADTIPGTNFLGTTDLKDLVFKTNNIKTGFISDDGLSVQFGIGAGDGSASQNGTSFIGYNAGFAATTAAGSNFIGYEAGFSATNSFSSNFIGTGAGYEASQASYSNFIGVSAGFGAVNASDSVFIGQWAGESAINAETSNFIGAFAGQRATNATESTFIGRLAGGDAPNAANSIFIGNSAGRFDTVNNTTNSNDFSILIGNNSSTGGFKNSIALGAYATNTASNQFIIGSNASRPINSTRIEGSGLTQCTITTGTGIACTSDERLKKNINDLQTTTLETLLNVRTVTYNWLQNPTSKTQIGFLAQDLEQYFPELVDTDTQGMKSVYYAQMTPILVEAIRELNLKVTDFSDTNTDPKGLVNIIRQWLASATNGITRIFAKNVRVENGVEMKDRATGEIYCTYIENGEFKKVAGDCESIPNQQQVVSIPSNSDPIVSTDQPQTDSAPDTTTESSDQSTVSDTPSSEPELTPVSDPVPPSESVPTEPSSQPTE